MQMLPICKKPKRARGSLHFTCDPFPWRSWRRPRVCSSCSCSSGRECRLPMPHQGGIKKCFFPAATLQQTIVPRYFSWHHPNKPFLNIVKQIVFDSSPPQPFETTRISRPTPGRLAHRLTPCSSLCRPSPATSDTMPPPLRQSSSSARLVLTQIQHP